jgi:hypothetical protein
MIETYLNYIISQIRLISIFIIIGPILWKSLFWKTSIELHAELTLEHTSDISLATMEAIFTEFRSPLRW